MTGTPAGGTSATTRALIVGGVALAVATTGAFLSGSDDTPSIAASKLFEQVRALSPARLGSMEAPGSPPVPLAAAAAKVRSGTVARPAFEDDDLVDPPPPLPEDDDLPSRAAEPTTGGAPGTASAPVAAPGSRAAARPAKARVVDPRRITPEAKRSNADGRPGAPRPAFRPGAGVRERPGVVAPAISSPVASAPRRSAFATSAAPHAAGGNANAGSPTHDDPDSVLPPSPP